MSLYPGATLGSPRFWCATCLRPRNFAKRLRERMVALEEQHEQLMGEGAELWNILSKLLAGELEIQDGRAESLAE